MVKTEGKNSQNEWGQTQREPRQGGDGARGRRGWSPTRWPRSEYADRPSRSYFSPTRLPHGRPAPRSPGLTF